MKVSKKLGCLSLIVSMVVFFIFPAVSFAADPKVRIADGILYFSPESDAPLVNMEELKLSFTGDSPKEILAIQGKIYGGKTETRPGNESQAATIYLIPVRYDATTKNIRLLHITTGKAGTRFRSAKYFIEGVYNGTADGYAGSNLIPVDDKAGNEPISFYIVPVKQGYKLRTRHLAGYEVDLFQIADLPSK